MIAALSCVFEFFEAFPANMSFAVGALYMVVSSMLLDICLAFRAFLYSWLFLLFLEGLSSFPLGAGKIRMGLAAV